MLNTDFIHQLSDEFFTFIKDNSKADPKTLRLRMHGKRTAFDADFAITQIECRKKAARKLSRFLENPGFLFPDTLAAEQASHQAVAEFHSSLLGTGTKTVLDMTAGLGIDVMTMSECVGKATAIELDPVKHAVLVHNASLVGRDNLTAINADSTAWLENHTGNFDVIFIDPARRGSDNSRTYNFHDCRPDILAIQDGLLERCRTLLIKASPLLDISRTLEDIHAVRAIRVVCVNGECKEVLVESALHSDSSDILFEAVDLDNEGNILSRFSYDSLRGSCSSVDSFAAEEDLQPGVYLYEPNAAVMKLAPWKELTERFNGLRKLAPSSHLFIADTLYPDFPGRILMLEKAVDKKDRKSLKGSPVNVAVRNYPLGADDLRRKLGVREGNEMFLYGTTLSSPVLLLAKKIRT